MQHDNIRGVFEVTESAKNQKKLFAQINGTKYTYQKLFKDISKLNVLFQSNGLQKGDEVILSTDDEYFTALFFLSFLNYGIVTIFLDPTAPPKRAIPLIQKSNAKGFVMDKELFEGRGINIDRDSFCLQIKKDGLKKGLLFKRLLKKKDTDSCSTSKFFPGILETLNSDAKALDPIYPSDLAYIFFTSGTTADPKGVMINHGNLAAHLSTLSKVYTLDESARILNILMMYHADGSIQGPLLALYNQSTWLCPMRFDLSNIGELFHSVYKLRVSHFVSVPTILSFMNKFSEGYEDSFQTEDFKFIISVASKLEKKLWEDFEQKFKVQLVNVYGLTETVAGSIFCGVNDFPRKIGTIGVPVDCEVKIINDDGSPTSENEDGHLWLKGPHVFHGYYNNPQATSAVLKDGWLNTGDLATKDSNGFIRISGRTKSMINTGGLNVYPEQVSEMVNTHPGVLENICLGIKDDNFGEKLVCAIVLKPGEDLNKVTLLSFLRPLLEQNQIPKEIFFFDDLPKGLSGKIQINEVKKMIASLKTEESNSSGSDNIEIIKEKAADAFGLDTASINIDDTSHTLDGWDSMAHLLFITSLEKHFKIRFSTAEMMIMNSINATKTILNKKINGQ